ncbi:MAG: hypothetical protein ACREO4_06415 [Lysobacter sp.]
MPNYFTRIEDIPATWRGRLFVTFGRWVIRRAAWKPYFHLRNVDGTAYMDRYWLVRIGRDGVDEHGQPKPWISLRVHHIRSSDIGRHFHDHPWTFVSLVLFGGYHEDKPYDAESGFTVSRLRNCPSGVVYTRETYIAGEFLLRRASDWHRLRLPDQLVDAGTWTLVLTLPKRPESWGFLVDGKKVPWREYFSARKFADAVARVRIYGKQRAGA